ncbi:hypothetical protein ACIBG8_05570 [Nonomuraea sp. NPDC050556]
MMTKPHVEGWLVEGALVRTSEVTYTIDLTRPAEAEVAHDLR